MKRGSNHQQRFIIVALILIGLLIGFSVEQTLRYYRNNSNHASKQTSQNQNREHDDQKPPTTGDHQSVMHQSEDDQTTMSSSMLKAYIRMNSMRAYHLDLHTYRDEFKFGGDPKFVDSLSDEDKQRCTSHLGQYHNLLSLYHNTDPISDLLPLNAIKLADTFGRPEAGVLNGNQYWLGNYQLCNSFALKANINETDTQVETVKGQFCFGVAQFPNWKTSEGLTSVKIGLCLPETCTSSMLSEDKELLEQVQTMMMYHVHPGGPFSKLQLRHVYCLPHETSELRQLTFSAKALISLLAGMLMFAIFATILDYDTTQKDQQQHQQIQSQKSDWRRVVIESFSITRNVKQLFRLRDSSTCKASQEGLANIKTGDGHEDVDYSPFNEVVFFETMAGLKTLGLFWIIAGHVLLVSPIITTGLADLDYLTKTYLADIYLAAHLMVDTFFVFMGMIASFMIFKDGINKFTSKHWILITVHRYWRLTPIYLICYWYTKSLGALVNSGPMWDFATSEVSPRVNCARESWLVALLHLSDFKSPKDHCVPFAWFIANGIKFCIVTPLFLMPFAKSMKRGYSVIVAGILANTLLVYWLANGAEVDVKSVIEFKPESANNMLNNMGQVYTRPYSRIGAYLIGLLVGHLFFLEQSGALRIKLTRSRARIGWMVFSLLTLGLMFLMRFVRFLNLDENLMRDSFSTGSAIMRPLWSLCSCWLVFALTHGQAKWLTSFLSAKFWLICVKLSFCAYLSQGEVIANLFLNMPVVNIGTQYLDLISRPLFVIVLTILVSFFMVIFIEYPLNGIEKLIFPAKKIASHSKHKFAIATPTNTNMAGARISDERKVQ